MPFQPANEQHAIVEVVFQLGLQRPLNPGEVERLVGAHGRWKADLPRINRVGTFQFVIGNTPGVMPITPSGGVSFEAVKKDGTIEWRLKAEENTLTVNCLSYTRWNDIWTKSRDFLQQSCETILVADNAVRTYSLQYIDMFKWEGDPIRYDLSELLRSDSELVPSGLFKRGALWHCFQGWYQDVEGKQSGRLLIRPHLDSVEMDGGQFVVKLDTFLSYESEAPHGMGQDLFGGTPAHIDAIFDWLHDSAKGLLRDYITDAMRERIGLDA